ncbi:MAG: hypothetical protein QM831_02280 [Kofleriaceae bacterium]
MTRLALVIALLVSACGGPDIPQGNGYKANAKPWKKFKTLKFDEKGEAKSEGDLSYPASRRAAWFAVDLPTPGEIDFRIEITPPGEAVNDAFDLGAEVLDSGYRMLVRKDNEEGDAQGDLNKQLVVKDQPPGRYYIHLYLQGRLDTCDYILHAVMKGSAPAEVKSDFPAQVAFVGPLPMVPLTDDTPKNYHPPTTVVTTTKHPVIKHTATPPPPPPPTTKTARIISMSVVSGGTQITIGMGTNTGATSNMKGKINGVANGSFQINNCNERACTAVVQGVTPDQIKQSGQVTLFQ